MHARYTHCHIFETKALQVNVIKYKDQQKKKHCFLSIRTNVIAQDLS
jgi:hypothetical protein